MTNQYDDIINLPNWNPKNHPRMPMANRAAQFAPFAALAGHDDAIRETARQTDQRRQLDDETVKDLNEKMAWLLESIALQPEIEVAFFVEDRKKTGGSYASHKGALRRIDETERVLVFTDGMQIPISAISAITVY